MSQAKSQVAAGSFPSILIVLLLQACLSQTSELAQSGEWFVLSTPPAELQTGAIPEYKGILRQTFEAAQGKMRLSGEAGSNVAEVELDGLIPLGFYSFVAFEANGEVFTDNGWQVKANELGEAKAKIESQKGFGEYFVLNYHTDGNLEGEIGKTIFPGVVWADFRDDGTHLVRPSHSEEGGFLDDPPPTIDRSQGDDGGGWFHLEPNPTYHMGGHPLGGMTFESFTAPTGKMRITRFPDDSALIEFEARGLVPNGFYTMWNVTRDLPASPDDPKFSDEPLGNRASEDWYVYVDAQGSVKKTYWFKKKVGVVFLLDYHSDGKPGGTKGETNFPGALWSDLRNPDFVTPAE